MKTVLITGVGRGIGRALAQTFLAEGYAVIGTFHSNRHRFTDKNFTGYTLNLASPKSISRCAKEIQKHRQKVDIYINNAGVLVDEDEIDVAVGTLRKTLEVNLLGTIDFTERMLASINTGGHIVNISSSAGSLELTGKGASHHPLHYPSYKISKAALNMYTRTLALRLKDSSTSSEPNGEGTIVVSSVHPGWVKTKMGGSDAEISPEKAAKDIFDFAITHPKTGHFWCAGKKLPW